MAFLSIDKNLKIWEYKVMPDGRWMFRTEYRGNPQKWGLFHF